LLCAGVLLVYYGREDAFMGGQHWDLVGQSKASHFQSKGLIAREAAGVSRSQVAREADYAAIELAGSGDFSQVSWDQRDGLWDRQQVPPGGTVASPPVWWQTGISLLGLVDYLTATRNTQPNYSALIAEVYSKHVIGYPGLGQYGNFENGYMDDTAWWGLAWAAAADYELHVVGDVTAARTYLNAAATIDRYIESQPRSCGGAGIDFAINAPTTDPPDTIADTEFIALSARLAQLEDASGPLSDPGAGAGFLADARSVLAWIEGHGLINVNTGLVRYNLNGSCRPFGRPMTYTEGETADALVQVGRATGDPTYYSQAERFIAALANPANKLVDPRNDVLAEPCELTPHACNGVSYNRTVFKGITTMAIADWTLATGSPTFRPFLEDQAAAVVRNAANNGDGVPGTPEHCQSPHDCQFSMFWAVRPTYKYQLEENAGSQTSGLMALTAALEAERS
jgi:hypothetical protein